MFENGIQQLLDSGVLGIVTVFLGYAYWKERERNSTLNEKRMQEHGQMYEKFIMLSEKMATAVDELTEALGTKEA